MSWFTCQTPREKKTRTIITGPRELTLVSQYAVNDSKRSVAGRKQEHTRRDSVVESDVIKPQMVLDSCDLMKMDDINELRNAVSLLLQSYTDSWRERRELLTDFEYELYHLSVVQFSVRDKNTVINSLLRSMNNNEYSITAERVRRFVLDLTAVLKQ